MIPPVVPNNERERLKALRKLEILDTEAEREFDQLVELASQICGTPISLISLIDDERQWFKSKIGLKDSQTPRDLSFCGHAINEPDVPFIIEDAHNDERFYDNPYVTGDPFISFYAGVPIKTSEGLALGTLCVIDSQPNHLSEEQIAALKVLSNQAMKLIELRYKNKVLHSLNNALSLKNKEIERFAHVAAHDLKSPLSSIISIIYLIKESKNLLPDEVNELIEMIEISATSLSDLIVELLSFAKLDDLAQAPKTEFSVADLKSELLQLLVDTRNLEIVFNTSIKQLTTNKTACKRILHNLITNAIKYNDKALARIEIMVKEDNACYYFSVKDNGPGISEEKQASLFMSLSVATEKDKYGNRGTGMGLANIKALLEQLGCDIDLTSHAGEGCNFAFTLPKG
ncbi:GAF domain-containing protein [bacterium]|nr:GAF domain-containing protein [bacterium]